MACRLCALDCLLTDGIEPLEPLATDRPHDWRRVLLIGHPHHADEGGAVGVDEGEADDKALSRHETLRPVDRIEDPSPLALAARTLEAVVDRLEEARLVALAAKLVAQAQGERAQVGVGTQVAGILLAHEAVLRERRAKRRGDHALNGKVGSGHRRVVSGLYEGDARGGITRIHSLAARRVGVDHLHLARQRVA